MISGAVVAHAGFQLLAWLYTPVSIYIAKNKFEQLCSHDETHRSGALDSSLHERTYTSVPS